MTGHDLDEAPPGADAPPRSLIVTIFGLYLRELGGWISVRRLIRLMAAVGVDEQAVRSSISRLKRRGVLEAERREGRDGGAGYALSAYAREILAVGDQRIFAERPTEVGRWAVVVFSVPETERRDRHALRTRLSSLGFGTVSSGVWIAPGHLAEDTAKVLAGEGLDHYVDLFLADYLAFGDPAERLARWWDLEAIDARYREFLALTAPLLEGWHDREPSAYADEALRDWVRVLTVWRRLPYLDPGLPSALLPGDWSGATAERAFRDLRDRLSGAAHDFATHP